MAVVPVTPDTTVSGRGWRTLTPAAAPGSLVADDSLPPDVDSDAGLGEPEAPEPRTPEPPSGAAVAGEP